MRQLLGTIKLVKNGFGFISQYNKTDIFFHSNNFDNIDFNLRKQEEVIYSLGEGRNGKNQAINISLKAQHTLEEIENIIHSMAELIAKDEEEIGFLKFNLIRKGFMNAIAELIVKYPNQLRNIEWRELERTLAVVFEGLGFETELTRSGKDGGFDIKILFKDGNNELTYLVEVKHWLASGQKPGDGILNSFVDVVATSVDNNTSGLLLSSSGFTKSVLRGRCNIKRHRVKLGDSEKIQSLCQHYIANKQGIFLPEASLSKILLSGTF